MPYNKRVYRVLGGGLDFTTRPTEIPDDKAQKMTNCALDQNGSIRQRKGHSLLGNASGRVVQMIKALDSRWQATSAAVDKDFVGLISVPDAFIVGFKDFVWAGNDRMRKSDGTNDWRWIPEAPTEAPTISTAEEIVTKVDDFTGGWVEGTSIDDENEGEEPPEEPEEPDYDANGLFVQGADDTVKSYTKEVSLNLYDGFDKDDLFRVRLRAKKWTNVSGVSLEMDCNDGSFKKDFYKVKMPLKEILAGRKETVTFYIRKRPLEVAEGAQNKNQWGAFERIGQTTDKDYRSIVALRVKVEFRLATRFWFSNWEMVGNEDNTLEGDDFGVYYTRTTEAGHESNPSPKSKLITVNHGSINVEGLDRGSDPQVTGVNIYLTGGTLGAVYRANGAKLDPETGDPVDGDGPITTSTYTIIASANDLSNLNIQLEDDHDDPPEADGIAGPYFGRILAWKGRRYYWTHVNKPYAFANPDGPDGDWNEVGENCGDIKWISVRPEYALIYGENDIYILRGDPGNAFGVSQTTNAKMGTLSRNGVAQAGPADIAYLVSGIYIVDSSGAPRKISGPIEPIFQGRDTLLWDGTTVEPITDPTTVAVGYEDGKVRVSHSGGTFNYIFAGGAIDSGRWVGDSRDFTTFQSEGESGMLGGRASGEVVKLEDGFTDNGAPIQIDYLSKAYDCGIHDNEKRFEDVTTFHDLGGETLTMKFFIAETAPISTTITSFGRERTVFQLNDADGRRARNVAVQFTGGVSTDIFIDAIDLNFYAENREAYSYDTEVIDAGTSKVKLIREIQPSLENDNGVTLTLETDGPGLALGIVRETHAIGARPFRRTQGVVMTTDCYANDFRATLSSEGFFHLGKVWALVQVIGTYLKGVVGEYYLSDPVDFGTERVKLAREIEIVYSTLGTAQLKLYTDLPSGVLTLFNTYTLTQAIGEQTRKIRLTGLTLGRLFQIRIEPTVDFRMEALRMRVKMVGEPAATAWQWIDFPLEKTQDAIWVDMPIAPDQVA